MNRIDKVLEDSFKDSNNENWIYTLNMEYIDDNEGLNKKEYFQQNWMRNFPLDIDYLSEEEIEGLEEKAYTFFK